jgi:lactate dehydrogenase-like 2-hydroxyacid dehydrogenase
MTRVLRVGNLKADLSQELETKYDALVLPTDDSRAAFLAEHGPDVTVVVTSGRFGVDRALMDALPALEAIVSYGVGYDTTDVTAAVERGIQISNTPDVLTDCVADTAVGLALDVMRGLSAADRFVRRGEWPSRGDFPLTRRLAKARVGILGLGRIGSAIATRLSGFGCQISYHSLHEVPGSPYTFVGSPRELAAAVDLFVVAASGGPSSAGLVSREVLEALGPDGFLVNVSRGSVVDEDALVDLVTTGGLGGAGLDVFANEPHVPEKLLDCDNVVLLPHLASGTVETRADMRRLTIENLASWLDHGKLVTQIREVVR